MAFIRKSFSRTLNMTLLAGALAALSGCATSSLLNNTTTTQTTNERTVLVEDRVVAFGNPARSSTLSSEDVVIVGEKHSYVLNDGGRQLVNLLSRLDPKNIHVDNDLNFYSEKNDGVFTGQMKLSYVKLKDEFTRQDMQFFLQNNGTDCTNAGDSRMNAQRFCFNININGKVYPQVSNFQLVQSQYKPLSRPYQVAIYTQQSKTTTTANQSGVEKLVLFPFALAFDVVTLPFQILGAID